MTELAGLEQRHVTLSPVFNLNGLASFFDSHAFAALRNSFWVALVISDFSCFPASFFQKQEFFRPTRDLSPWALDQKSNVLPNWLAGLDESFFLLFLAVILNVRPIFFRVFCFYLTAHRDSFLITVVYSEFLCFLAFSSVKKGSFRHTQETQTLENCNKISTLDRPS